ncbi:hypothetical protein C2E23DRAFT_890470 [Lenzites betulinus]|nr:hypothetical protein C2E23DRAFT_890470 [Lenzites betulinus]
MTAFSSKIQSRPMYNSAAADYIAHGSRTLSPAQQNLDREQRLKLAKSSQKIGKMRGQILTIDILPASPGAYSIATTNLSCEPVQPLTVRKRGDKSERKLPLPPAQALHHKLPPVHTWNIPVEEGAKASLAPRKPGPIPAALNLVSPAGNEYESTLPYGYMRTPLTPEYLSPLTSLSYLETPDIHGHHIRRLARMSRALRDATVEERVIPSINGAAAPQVRDVNTYLDLYRMAVCPRPRSQKPPAGRRRSRSVGDEMQRLPVLTVSSASSGTSCSISSANSNAERQEHRDSDSVARSSPARASPLPTRRARPLPPRPIHFARPLPPTPPTPLDTPPVPARLRDSPLQQQQSAAHAKTAILGADTQRMNSFMCGFPVRMRRRTSGKRLPTTPTTPRTASGSPKSPVSPKVPYWVRSAIRGSVSPGGSRRRRAGFKLSRPPPTPRMIRKERRQGWAGDWRSLGSAVEKLKEMQATTTVRAGSEATGKSEEKRKAEEPDAVRKDEEPADEPASFLPYLQDVEEMDVYSGIVEAYYAL